ncbi:hypothetical protein DRF68_12645 [Candidatus Chryseobacterium massiliae]|uniref:Uncharacterized protein n=2 Tax=Chryseobacterium group TaxID=2782232 RepID=A0A3D9B2L7_9FLAO|nr:hypothetical protein DRF68_12645 [Candidatus Chryseobacterium massiliae]
MDRIFKIDFRKLAIEWLIIPLRTIWIINFLFVLIEPIRLLYIDFLSSRKQNIMRMEVTNQKYSIQKRLNDLFDKIERRIEIVKAVQFEGLYFYTKAEDDPFFNKTEWLQNDNPHFLRSKSELYSEFDFLVKIPNTGINLFQLKSEIEYFMLQSKNYKIEIV